MVLFARAWSALPSLGLPFVQCFAAGSGHPVAVRPCQVLPSGKELGRAWQQGGGKPGVGASHSPCRLLHDLIPNRHRHRHLHGVGSWQLKWLLQQLV